MRQLSIKNSIECWIISKDSKQVLLLTVPAKSGKNPEFNQPLTGGMEAGETPTEACLREIFEETGCKFTAPELTYLDTVNVRHGSGKEVFDFGYHAYRINLDNTPAITINDAEHQAYMWVSLDEALEMDLVEDQGDVQEMFTALLK